MKKKLTRLPTLADIREMILNRPETVSIAVLATVAGKSKDWVQRLCRGEIEAPGYPHIVAIHDFLISRTK